MSSIKISVIVPIYNAGEHLRRCLDSLVNQTMKEIEIILIVDCPTDGSDVVAENYARKYEQIRIVKNERNMHIGESRNKGLRIARGKYIGFCDHDDYTDPDMYKLLYEKIENEQSDIAVSPYISVDILPNGNQSIGRHIQYPPLNSFEAKSILWPIIIGARKNDSISKDLIINIWNKLYKKSIIDKYQIEFLDTKKATAEDVDFMCKYLYYCDKVSIVNKNLYYHVWGIGNTAVSYAYNKPDNIVSFLCSMNAFIENNHIVDCDIQERFRNTIIMSVLRSMRFAANGYFLKKVLYPLSVFAKCNIIIHAFCDTSIQNYYYKKTFKERLVMNFIRKYMQAYKLIHQEKGQ